VVFNQSVSFSIQTKYMKVILLYGKNYEMAETPWLREYFKKLWNTKYPLLIDISNLEIRCVISPRMKSRSTSLWVGTCVPTINIDKLATQLDSSTHNPWGSPTQGSENQRNLFGHFLACTGISKKKIEPSLEQLYVRKKLWSQPMCISLTICWWLVILFKSYQFLVIWQLYFVMSPLLFE
jgi:hypothetical protein